MMNKHPIVSKDQWLMTRQELLKAEKDFTKARDALTQKIRELPWMRIEKKYKFQTEEGTVEFEDLFEGRTQLIIYHFMFGPDWTEGCKSCSFWADNFNEIIIHLNQRDVTMLAVSRGPLDKLLEFRKRMNWSFKWASSEGSEFNFNYQVSSRDNEPSTYNYQNMPAGPSREMPGISVFLRDGKDIYHTYSTYGRGLDMFNTAYHFLDIVPKGRDEKDLSYGMEWVRLKDKY